MKSDFGLMRDVANHTRVDPQNRLRTLQGFATELSRSVSRLLSISISAKDYEGAQHLSSTIMLLNDKHKREREREEKKKK